MGRPSRGRRCAIPPADVIETDEDIRRITSVSILDPDLCPRYTARIIKNIRIGPSPFWMRRRLEAVGLRPINNIVDVTNFVMMELGQPLHAFDFRFLEKGENRGPEVPGGRDGSFPSTGRSGSFAATP